MEKFILFKATNREDNSIAIVGIHEQIVNSDNFDLVEHFSDNFNMLLKCGEVKVSGDVALLHQGFLVY